MRILILEDNSIRQEKFKELFKNQELYIFDSFNQELCDSVRKIDYQIMVLDHDLGGKIWVDSREENTGYSFVVWLVGNQIQKNSLIYTCSMNPIGANKMLNHLLDNGYDGIWHPFHLWKI
jgi:DNA-binding NarL/FixJ family response regulator